MKRRVKVFMNNRGQTVRLPKDFQFNTAEVFIRKEGEDVILSPRPRYLEFLRVYPSIALRVPQSMLASYLGMSPETVSRIRKRLSRRHHDSARGKGAN